MNIDQIKDQAPGGATHYEMQDDGEVCYFTKDYIGRWCSDDGCGCWWPLHSDKYEELDKNLKPL